MRYKILSLLAGGLLLAACASEQATSGGANTGGSSGGTTTPVVQGPAPGSQEDLVQNVGDRVYFDLDRYDLKPEAQATLERQAAWLQKYPSVTVTVEGHCDERGTREYNLALGERRANAVKNYLEALGVNGNRITTVSYGKERPEVQGSSEEAWAQNRRGVTMATGGAPSS